MQDVSFDVAPGEIFGVLGRNGAGKSTTVECIAGLRDRDAGQVAVCGIDPAADEPALRKVLGVQLQDAALPEKLTVDEALSLYASFYDDPAPTDELRDRLGLTPVGDSYFGRLSGGSNSGCRWRWL
ncbi:ATP-binding cassette domain-containing protein [Branchiibius cervicis]|uniref:ATP-binding cassette domain-containing protein n=1 Tax=Branchiibius cervicis TaxID=908252 RepID=A0ABW2ATZ0_9MICO